ncbi:hypothetical protein IOD16_19235 [Saccharothrix sp. 6-C]|uniref:hypothetical protein n=1 Tax=Saccharothrix sp. 6-C TaxID=2781735 RepID=UPI001916EFE2|nr:hypothetical protein [Saccharothrix sp. 6-C]QQQ73438.1 hypothetical protein IOD16_19235 [Saccharothrix sp. 6-C]
MDVSPRDVLTPDEIARRVERGRSLMLPVGVASDLDAASASARELRASLPEDLWVFASPGSVSGGPVLVVMRLVGAAQAKELRPALEVLIADFRQCAGALVAALRADVLPAHDRGDEHPGEVEAAGVTWVIEVHGEHCRFEDPVSGVVVEANTYDPDLLDPYFLLLFARTSGRHDAVLAACVHGFHDMCRLLDLAEVGFA